MQKSLTWFWVVENNYFDSIEGYIILLWINPQLSLDKKLSVYQFSARFVKSQVFYRRYGFSEKFNREE